MTPVLLMHFLLRLPITESSDAKRFYYELLIAILFLTGAWRKTLQKSGISTCKKNELMIYNRFTFSRTRGIYNIA